MFLPWGQEAGCAQIQISEKPDEPYRVDTSKEENDTLVFGSKTLIRLNPSVARYRSFALALLILPGLWASAISIFSGGMLKSSWRSHERHRATPVLVKHSVPATVASSDLINVFQVYQPVLIAPDSTHQIANTTASQYTTAGIKTVVGTSCQVLLMVHSFGLSYGKPFVGDYTPPNCEFNRVSMNFTVTSRGRQFDRIALMYFNDTEVWRTSTAEPNANGIRFEYIKDMTEYLYFWKSPQKVIFDLGNLIDSTYTAPFNTSLTATFWMSEETVEPAAQIIPISARKSSTSAPSVFSLPKDSAVDTITLPRNANRAVFAVSATGQATEEFWWSNVLQSDVEAFVPKAGTLYGYSPFREVQVLIDGQLAGVHWPFPVIFTGGIVPGLWRRIVGVDAYDLREHEIDITPWLGVLSDGQPHTFEILVAGIEDDGEDSGTLTRRVGNSWLVTGKIFLWLDSDSSAVTTGSRPTALLSEPSICLSRSLTTNDTGANQTLTYTTDVKRSLTVSSTITTACGTRDVSWVQDLAVTNYGHIQGQGVVQITNQTTIGRDESVGGERYKSVYSYPLWVNSTYTIEPGGNTTMDATLQRGLSLTVQGASIFPTGIESFKALPASEALMANVTATRLETTQNGTAHYYSSKSSKIASTYGKTTQEFSFRGLDTESGTQDRELYYRNVEAANGTITSDVESLAGTELGNYSNAASSSGTSAIVVMVKDPKQCLGRGPGQIKDQLVMSGSI